MLYKRMAINIWSLSGILLSLHVFLFFVIIILITVYPMYKAYKTIQNKPIGYFLLFFFAPVFVIILVILVILNTILSKGIKKQTNNGSSK